MAMIYLDTETTGLDPLQGHEIIEIAIVTDYDDGTTEYWECKIKPRRLDLADPRALEVNGYSQELWKDAKDMRDAIIDIGVRLQKGLVVGYNPHFDWQFIKHHLRAYGLEPSHRIRLIDTMVLVHEHLTPKGLRGLSLDAVRDFLGWEKSHAHTAMGDTLDCRKLYNMLLSR
jgi:DNA polymerase-3 subunit epsilon